MYASQDGTARPRRARIGSSSSRVAGVSRRHRPIEHDDLREPLGEVRGQVERQHAAERVADQYRVADAQRVEQADHVGGVVGHGVVGGRRRRIEAGGRGVAPAAPRRSGARTWKRGLSPAWISPSKMGALSR